MVDLGLTTSLCASTALSRVGDTAYDVIDGRARLPGVDDHDGDLRRRLVRPGVDPATAPADTPSDGAGEGKGPGCGNWYSWVGLEGS